MSDEKSLGKLIYTERKRLGLSQVKLADKFDTTISRITIGRWEKDEQRPTVQNFTELIGILDLNEQEAYGLYYAGGKTPPERHNLPLESRFFTGRTVYLEKLRELLEKHHVVAISGLGGIGKTELALQYAHLNYPDMYPAALWVNAANTETLQSSFTALAETLKLPEKYEQKPDSRIKAVREWLEEHTDWLLVMDNADELPDVEPFMLSKPHGHILLTTRWNTSVKFAKLLPLEVMEMEEGQSFLLGRTDRSPKEAELDAAGQIVEVLGGHALALEQAGAYIAETDISFVDYFTLYEKNRLSLLSQYGALKDRHNKHRLTVAATFRASLARAQELSSLAEDILCFCAFLQPDAIPHELFHYDNSFTADTMGLKEGVAALQRYSLIKPNALEVQYSLPHPLFSLHRLLQAVIVDTMSADLQKQWRSRIVQTLNSAFPLVDLRDWYQCARFLPDVLVCATWTTDEFKVAEVFVELFHKAYVYLRKRGSYSTAETLLEQVFPICKQQFGDEHLAIVPILIDLAESYKFNSSRSEQSESLFRQAYIIQAKQLGAAHPDTLSSLKTITYLHLFSERYPGVVLQARKKIHEIAEKDQVAIDLEATANLCHAQGKYAQAESAYRHALAIRKWLLGVEHTLTKWTQENYTEFLRSISQPAKAATLKKYDEPSV